MSRQQLPPQITKMMVTDRRTKKEVVRYEVVADAGRDPETGKRHQIRRRFKTEKEAREALSKFLDEAASGTFVPRKDVTVAEIIGDWLKSLHSVRRVTLGGYEYDLAPVKQRYGTLPVQKLTRKHLDELVVALREGGTLTEKGRVRRPWAPRSLNRTVDTTAMVLDYAMDRKLVARNVADQIKAVPRRPRKHDTFTAEEVRQVLDSIAQDRNEHLWHLALRGLRRAEIGGLRWRNIDFAAKALSVEIGRADARDGVVVEDTPKTEASRRTLPMDDELVEVLRRAHRRQAGEKLAVGDAYGKGGYVACDEAGRPYHPSTITHLWGKAAKAAGVRHIRLHDCRHTAGTLMHLRRVPIAVIAEWLGHTDAGFTQRTYAHSQRDALAEAAATLGAVVTTRDIETR
ncbi:tyrosine-type recombinase/integrase [Nocardia sp. NPDC004860]|uniref:tyrosine-type recombinase/integrase n=1 Tax=Nocardia sp. NPDC004860 TaxID=3154557 RepID=UPI0033A8817A